MSNLPALLSQMGGLPTQGIPQLRNHGAVSRVFHTWKLHDLQKISKLESEIAKNNLDKLNSNVQAFTLMATFGERMKAEMETIELTQRNMRAQVRQEEAKARVIENEARKEEFDFAQYMKSFQNED